MGRVNERAKKKYNNENNEENIIFDAGHAGFRQLLGRYKKK